MTQYALPIIDAKITSGTELAAFLNSWQPALLSSHAGAARPPYAVDGMVWLQVVSPTEWNIMLVAGALDVRIGTANSTTGQFVITGLDGYVPLTQKGAAFGVATLDLNAQVPDAQIPAAIARDSEVTAAMNAHVAAPDPHPGYLTPAEGAAAYEPIGSVAAHAAAPDPHPGYLTPAEGAAAYVPLTQRGAANGVATLDAGGTVPDAQIPAALARDAEVTAAMNAHVAAGDPHPGYLTPAEGAAAYEPVGSVAAHAAAADPHPGYLTPAEGAAAYEPVGSVAAHAAAPDPHPGYLTAAEGNAAYLLLTGGTLTGQLVAPSVVAPRFGTLTAVNVALMFNGVDVVQYSSQNFVPAVDNFVNFGVAPNFRWATGAFSQKINVTSGFYDSDGNHLFRNGTNDALRLIHNPAGVGIDLAAVDSSGSVAFQPFFLTGKHFQINANNGFIDLMTGGTSRWQVTPAGHLAASVDNNFDIGAAASARPRTGYFGTSVVAPDFVGSGVQLSGVEKLTSKGVANGYASLDATGKVPTAQLPPLGGGSDESAIAFAIALG